MIHHAIFRQFSKSLTMRPWGSRAVRLDFRYQSAQPAQPARAQCQQARYLRVWIPLPAMEQSWPAPGVDDSQNLQYFDGDVARFGAGAWAKPQLQRVLGLFCQLSRFGV